MDEIRRSNKIIVAAVIYKKNKKNLTIFVGFHDINF